MRRRRRKLGVRCRVRGRRRGRICIVFGVVLILLLGVDFLGRRWAWDAIVRRDGRGRDV